MKICIKCKEKRKEDDFCFRNKNKGIRQNTCKICTRKGIRGHYHRNQDYYLTKAKIRNKKNRIVIQEYILDYLKSHPCIDCSETDPVVLEFDHIEDKKKEIGYLLSGGFPLNTIKREITKCVVRCANCHRRKTAKDFNWYKLTDNMHP